MLIQPYAERTVRDTGHQPTDDEILSYLADEKTRDLHTRLIERDREAERLPPGRAPRRAPLAPPSRADLTLSPEETDLSIAAVDAFTVAIGGRAALRDALLVAD